MSRFARKQIPETRVDGRGRRSTQLLKLLFSHSRSQLRRRTVDMTTKPNCDFNDIFDLRVIFILSSLSTVGVENSSKLFEGGSLAPGRRSGVHVGHQIDHLALHAPLSSSLELKARRSRGHLNTGRWR